MLQNPLEHKALNPKQKLKINMSVKKSVLEQFDTRKLEKYLVPENTYTVEAVRYAVEILQKRGRVFTEEELSSINGLILKKESSENEERSLFHQWDKNATTEHNAIELYSNKLLYVFGILFSVVFASVLLAINFHKLKLKTAMIFTLLFGLSYTVLLIIFSDQISNFLNFTGYNFSNSFIFSAIGVLGLQAIWTRYIPFDLKYRKKSFVTPLIIALLIFSPLIYFMVTT